MIDGANVARRVAAMMPPGSVSSITLGSRGASESGYTSYTWDKARTCPATNDMLMEIGASTKEEYVVFELYKINEAVTPKIGDKITDSESVVWQIKKIDVRMQRYIFRCLCLKNI